MTLLEHHKDCTPLTPCPSCELVAWLRVTLSADAFRELTERAQKLKPSLDGSRRGNPVPAMTAIGELWAPAPLSVRLLHALTAKGCITIEDILKTGRREWLHQPNFGRKCLNELEAALKEAGHELSPK